MLLFRFLLVVPSAVIFSLLEEDGGFEVEVGVTGIFAGARKVMGFQ